MKKYLLITVVSLLTGAFAALSPSVTAESEEGEVGGLKMFIDVTTMKEHMKMMKAMKTEMKMEPGATHYLSVNLEDEKTGEKITEVEVSMSCLSAEGKEVDSGTLGYMPKMGHFGGDITLKDKGKYYVKIVTYRKEIKMRYSVTIPFAVL